MLYIFKELIYYVIPLILGVLFLTSVVFLLSVDYVVFLMFFSSFTILVLPIGSVAPRSSSFAAPFFWVGGLLLTLKMNFFVT